MTTSMVEAGGDEFKYRKPDEWFFQRVRIIFTAESTYRPSGMAEPRCVPDTINPAIISAHLALPVRLHKPRHQGTERVASPQDLDAEARIPHQLPSSGRNLAMSIPRKLLIVKVINARIR